MRTFTSAPHLATFAGGDAVNSNLLIERPDDALYCAWCGSDLKHPEYKGMVAKFQPSVGFNNYIDLAVPSSRYLCPHCQILSDGQKYMLQAKTAVACPEGIFPLSKDVHLQQFFLNPPQPPFVVVYSTAKQMHLYWRTPISLSRNLFTMRFNNELAVVRRLKVLQVVEKSNESLRLVNELLTEKAKLKKPLFTLLAADYRDARKKTAADSGLVSGYALHLANKTEDGSLIQSITEILNELQLSINELNPIEIWWLTVIGKTGIENEPDFVWEPLYNALKS